MMNYNVIDVKDGEFSKVDDVTAEEIERKMRYRCMPISSFIFGNHPYLRTFLYGLILLFLSLFTKMWDLPDVNPAANILPLLSRWGLLLTPVTFIWLMARRYNKRKFYFNHKSREDKEENHQ